METENVWFIPPGPGYTLGKPKNTNHSNRRSDGKEARGGEDALPPRDYHTPKRSATDGADRQRKTASMPEGKEFSIKMNLRRITSS